MGDLDDDVDPQSWESWLWALVDEDLSWCVTVIHGIDPISALTRSIATAEIHEGTWRDAQALEDHLRGQRSDQSAPWDTVVGAFRLGDHTLLLDDGTRDRHRPALSEGTFAISSHCSINGETSLLAYRDGELVTEINDDSADDDLVISADVRDVLRAMGSDDPVDTVIDHGLELLCRTAGVRVTVSDVDGSCFYAIDPKPWPAPS